MSAVSILDKDELIAMIEEILEGAIDDLLTGDITAWDLASDIAVEVLK